VIAVLVVSLVLLSTQVYIFEVSKPLESSQLARANDFVLAIKLGSEHVVAGSLANVSIGGDYAVLSSNIGNWASFLASLYQAGLPVLDFALADASPYVNGTRVSWDVDGFGITSAYVDFDFSLEGGEVNVQLPYTVNVSTSLFVEGVYRRLVGDIMQVNVTCHLLGDEGPVLAENVTVFLEKSGVWLRADERDGYRFADYGNGTYLVVFEQDYLPSETVKVSAQVYDQRLIYVQANATCTEAA
jgi:hypothetical protein